MEKEKIIKLFKLLLSYIENNNNPRCSGLCVYINDFFYQDESPLSFQDRMFLREYINKNRPKIFRKFYSFKQYFKNSDYFWEPGNDEIRIKWLNYQINKLNK